MPYQIQLLPAAIRDLGRLEPLTRQRIADKISTLAAEPRPHGVEKLAGRDSRYRVRVGDYRIIYEIHDQRVLVLVARVGHRREVYR